MRLHPLIPLVAAAANLLVCVPVLRQRGRRPIHWAFAWMTFTIALWNLGIFSLYYFSDPTTAEWWSRIFRTGICFAPVAVFHIGVLLSGARGRWRVILGAGYVAATLLAIANLAGLLVSGVRPHVWGWYPQPTRLYAGVSILVLVYLGLAVERVSFAYRRPETPRQRAQAKFWFLAMVVQVPFVVTNLLPMYGISVYPLGNFGNVLYVGILAYAIARHRLMDVDYVVRKFVSFSLAAAVVFIPGGMAFVALARAMGNESVVSLCAALVLALLATVLIPALQHGLETRLQRALFPSRHDYRARLRRLTTELVHVLDRAALLAKLGGELEEILDLERCEVFARHEETGRWLAVHPSADEAIPPDEILERIEDARVPILGVEIEAVSERAAAIFQARSWEVVMPLRMGESLTAFVMLGRNKEFRLFSGEDLQLLTTVAANASVALENARLSAQLRRSEKVLEQSSRLSSLGMLAAGIAHEIRNPLAAVKTFLDLLPDRVDDRDFLTDFRNMSLSELRRVTNLITDLLALGKSTSAKHGAVELAGTLEPVIRLMESTARKRQIEVMFSAEDRLPTVFANPDQLKQITLNLILNAIDASPPGANVTVALRAAGAERVVLEILDKGSGIPPETLDRIFDPFYTTKETGTGLGLALVHQMVVEHGGEITVESEVGRGTAFRVRLPAAGAEFQRTGT